MAAAADAVPALLPHGPIAIEGMDHRIVDVVRHRRGAAAVPPLPAGRGWLFVEVGGASAAEAGAVARGLVRDAEAADATDSRIVPDGDQAATLWRIREDGSGLSGRSPAGAPAHAGWEDAAVPPERLGAYLRDFDALMAERGLTGMPYGHFGDGCVHVRIDYPLDRPEGVPIFRDFVTDAAALVARYGGSMSGEHGDGRARGELLPHMYSRAALDAFAAVKHAFDPDDVLNPGVIVRPRPLAADLRRPAATRPVPVALRYPHDGGGEGGDRATAFATAVHRCTGVGRCVTAGSGVMCPSYLATRDEKDSTRGRARVLQEMINGGLVTGGWRAPELRESLDLCLACKGCASDCPTGVDMATYKAEVLHHRHRGRVRPRTHYSLGWLPRWARLAALAPGLTNRLANRAGPLAKRLAGIDHRRPLPRFAGRTFRGWFRRRARPAGGDPVLLWVDTFTDHFTPEVGVAAVRVLEAAGFAVRIPSRPVCCGLTWHATGQFGAARRVLRRGLAAVAGPVAAGVPVVALEPSCAASLRGATDLLDPADPLLTMLLTEPPAVRTLAELLTERGWRPPRLHGLEVLAQPHCHQHAVLGWGADRALLAAAGADVRTVAGCCGLAGSFGMERGHYEVSVAVAETNLLPAVRVAGPGTAVLADGFSCRTQLAHLAGRPGRHLAQLLADALDR
jgi:Fe-S oxidoreductase